MTRPQAVAAIRDKRRALTDDAVKVLAESLHAKFCDPDHEAVGGWDEAVVRHVVRGFMELPAGMHGALLATIALEPST